MRRRSVGALLVIAACGAEAPTGIVVEVKSDLSVEPLGEMPAEIDDFVVKVRSGQKVLFAGEYQLDGPHKTILPNKIGFLQEGDDSGPIDIDVSARKGSRPRVLKTVRVSFKRHTVHQIQVHLNRDCLNILCPEGKTCASGSRAGRCESSSFPPGPRESDGPPCNCFSLFPMCVGARWEYDEFRNGVRFPKFKRWSIASFGPMNDPRHGQETTLAFLQVRPSALDFSHKWISALEKPRRLFWEKEDQFNPDLVPVTTRYFMSHKIRLDESLTAPRDNPKPEDYAEFEYRPGNSDPIKVKIENHDAWNIESVEDVRKSTKNFPERFAKETVICHRRVGKVVSVVGTDEMYPDSEKIFCFVASIGKIYERTIEPNPGEEVLVDWLVPSCSKGP